MNVAMPGIKSVSVQTKEKTKKSNFISGSIVNSKFQVQMAEWHTFASPHRFNHTNFDHKNDRRNDDRSQCSLWNVVEYWCQIQ